MLQEKLDLIIKVLAKSKEDLSKFEEKNNSAASTRVRKKLMAVVRDIKDLRNDILETRKERRE
tara:strand:- start:3267 stop:3455 length:189 start_codon:yes stop_codon:yes gene_type:complete